MSDVPGRYSQLSSDDVNTQKHACGQSERESEEITGAAVADRWNSTRSPDHTKSNRFQRRRHFGCWPCLALGGHPPDSETSSDVSEYEPDDVMQSPTTMQSREADCQSDHWSSSSSPTSEVLDIVPLSDQSFQTFAPLDTDFDVGGESDPHCQTEDSTQTRLTRPVRDEFAGLSVTVDGLDLNISIDDLDRPGLSLSSPTQEDREFYFLKTDIRRSTSLKSGKTPPGSPRKKVVRFADALGLDLASIRHILDADAAPHIPASAVRDLRLGLEEELRTQGSRHLAACFHQPGAGTDFIELVRSQKVCLENAMVSGLTVTGTVRVANVSFHKVVTVRWTSDGWRTSSDVPASYVIDSCDGATDRFAFTICAPPDFSVGHKLQFAIAYAVGGAVYWDNNHSQNYVFECYAKSYPSMGNMPFV